MPEERWPEWLVEYQFEGRFYLITIPARTAEEAKSRLLRAGMFGSVQGEKVMTISASWIPNWAVNTLCAVRNFFARLGR